MSILNRLPHVAKVYLTKDVAIKYNETKKVVDYDNPIEVSCFVQMVSTEETFAMGKSLNSVYRVFAKTWPGQFDSVIQWRGRSFKQVGDADDTTDIPRVGHVELLMETSQAVIKNGV